MNSVQEDFDKITVTIPEDEFVCLLTEGWSKVPDCLKITSVDRTGDTFIIKLEIHP